MAEQHLTSLQDCSRNVVKKAFVLDDKTELSSDVKPVEGLFKLFMELIIAFCICKRVLGMDTRALLYIFEGNILKFKHFAVKK